MGVDYRVHVGPYVECRPGPGGPSWGDVSEALREQLYPSVGERGTTYWFPNVDRGAPRPFGFDPREGAVVRALTADDLGAELVWFMTAFSAEVLTLLRAYGRANVFLRWGVVSVPS